MTRSRGSSVSIVSDYKLDDRGSSPTGAEDFSSSLCVQTGSGTHPATLPHLNLFLRIKLNQQKR
jgi:hypothetical protein